MTHDPNLRAEVQSWRVGALRVLRLAGELDALTVPAVRARLDEALATFGEPALIVDLTRVTFIASAGIGALVQLRAEAAARRDRLIVVLPLEGRARRLFELTRMVDHFDTRPTLHEAVRALRGEEP